MVALVIGGAIALGAQQPPDRSKLPASGAVPVLKLPAIEKRQLSNGLPVWIVELHEVPVVQVNLVVLSGSAADPNGKYGVASMTAAMLDDGAGVRSALEIADAVDFIGLPEGKLALAQAAVYLATAPKSNALYAAYGHVVEALQKAENEPVPLHLRNAVTPLMSAAGYGKGYQYAHDLPGHFAPGLAYLPEGLSGRTFYEPSDQGFEKEVAQRIAGWDALREKAAPKKKPSKGKKA